MWELSFSGPLTLSNYRQLTNISGVIPTHHDLDNILLIECIRDFRGQGVFRTDQEQVVRVRTEAGWFYVPRSLRSVQSLHPKLNFQSHVHAEYCNVTFFVRTRYTLFLELNSIGADRRDQLFEWL